MSRRLPPRRRLTRPQWAISVGLGLAIIGFVGAAQWNSSLARQVFVTSAQRVLTSEAEQLQREQEALRAEIEAADEQLQGFQEEDAESQAVIGRLTGELAAARAATGLQDLRGPGAVIEIADSLRAVPVGESTQNYIVLPDDLRAIVTALWAVGAEAITIAGGAAEGVAPERIVATTSIDGAGPAILVNSARLTPPYRIEAIGPEGLHDRFLAHPNYQTRIAPRIDAYSLQFASEPRDDMILPRFIGNTSLRWGVPVTEAD